MNLRTLHRVVGLLTAPLMVITAFGGTVLLFRRTGWYERRGDFRGVIQDLHNYEIIASYIGAVAAVMMVVVAATGVALFVQIRRRKRKARR